MRLPWSMIRILPNNNDLLLDQMDISSNARKFVLAPDKPLSFYIVLYKFSER